MTVAEKWSVITASCMQVVESIVIVATGTVRRMFCGIANAEDVALPMKIAQFAMKLVVAVIVHLVLKASSRAVENIFWAL